MRINLNRRAATAFGLAVATAGSIAFAAGPASADVITWLNQPPHNAGVYNYSSVASGKTGAWDLSPYGDGVDAVCWIRGDDLQNLGNVWYYIDEAYYTGTGWVFEQGYVYGGYVDGNWAYYNGLGHCGWGA